MKPASLTVLGTRRCAAPRLFVFSLVLAVTGWGAAATEETYRVGRGDVLQVVVPGDESLSRDYIVTATGHLLVPLIGKVLVEGLSVEEVTDNLSIRLKKYLQFPEVLVGVKESKPKPLRCYVLGEVKNPGVYVLEQGKARVLDAMALAGGLTPRSAGEKAHLYRATERPLSLDLKALIREGKIADNVALTDGDLIVVPTLERGEQQLTAFGEVNRPGVFEWSEGMKLLDFVSMAGGPTPRSDMQNAILNGQKIDIRRLLRDGDLSANVSVKPGSTLFLPVHRERILVLGEVKNPGAVEYRDDLRVLDALMSAGGVLLEAPVAGNAGLERSRPRLQAQVIREGEATISVDLDALLLKGKSSENLLLKPDDILRVSLLDDTKVSIFGAIAKPGFYSIREGETLLDVVTRAGFPRAEAALDKATILRSVPGKKPIVLHVDLAKVVNEGDQKQNAILQAGDIVAIPGKADKKRMGFTDVLGVLTPLAFFYDIVSRNAR